MVEGENPEPLVSNDFFDALSKALGLPPYLQRVIIDVNYGHCVKVYIEMVGDERLLHIDWEGNLKDTKIEIIQPGEAKS